MLAFQVISAVFIVLFFAALVHGKKAEPGR